MSAWPNSNDYTQAIQSPQICFRDPELKNASVERNKLTRMPKVWTGNFAQVYELKISSRRWAVKCFTRSTPDIRARYAEIAKAIGASGLAYFVEFRLIDDEMLVNGKRYPVVKMQWIDGQFLDKHIEANLYRPEILLGTATQILSMVKDLEAHQLAHGDLQHGNLVITASGLKLVDYDGMFVPSFAGRAASETGLPSYQHPRREAGDFGIGLDRFALLVICTGLCSLAVDPSLWYDFYTGDNLLFTSNDFRDPKSSKLFRRLSTLNDVRVRSLADLLRMACVQDPLFTPLPSGINLQTGGPRPVPWWVTLKDDRPGEKPSEVRELGAPGRTVNEFRHVGAATVSAIGMAVLLLAGFLSAETALLAALIGTIGYFLERLRRYNSLPALLHRRELQLKVERIRRELRAETDKKTGLEKQVVDLSSQEGQEKANELKRLRDTHSSAYLSTIPISRLMNISGIGPYVVGNFRNAGINNALELKQRGPYVQGVGQKRRSQILGQLAQWEQAAVNGSPKVLPPDLEARIEVRYQQQRQGLVHQLGAVNRRIGDLGSDLSNAEWQLKQIHMPTFSQFLKNTF